VQTNLTANRRHFVIFFINIRISGKQGKRLNFVSVIYRRSSRKIFFEPNTAFHIQHSEETEHLYIINIVKSVTHTSLQTIYTVYLLLFLVDF